MSGPGRACQWDVLGIGMSVLDSLLVVEEFPSCGGVTKVLRSQVMGGGPVPTALCAAARLGARAAVVDRIGADERGRAIAADYEKHGVDTRFLVVDGGGASAMGTVLVRERDGERHLLFEEGSAPLLVEADLPVEALRDCRVLHLNGRHWPACVSAAQIVRQAGGRVSFDGGALRFDSRFREILPWVDVLIVARDFAERLSGSTSRDRQWDALTAWRAEIVGITDGAKGSWFRSREGEEFHQPAFPVPRVVDTTGCGDVFHGAFLAALTRGSDWRFCARFASAAAAIKATALGGRGHLPVESEVRDRMGEG